MKKNLLKSMKINLSLFLALIAATSLSAAPLTKPTAVHVRPEASSAAVTLLPAGTEPKPATNAAAPAGWTAIELPGPHEVYVQNKDIMKSLDVKPGSSFYIEPKVDAPVLTTMVKGDAAEISGLHGRWTQIRLQKKLIGYISDGTVSSPVSPASSASYASVPATSNAKVITAGSPVAIDTGTPVGTGTVNPTPSATPAKASMLALPRLFEGTFVPARRFLAYKPYDFQLNDRSGQRYAFLDVSRLPVTDKAERYLDHNVAIFGTAKPIPNTKDIVIEVESIQIR